MPKKKRLPALIGYIVFGAVCLLLSLYWTFPAKALAARVATEVERNTGGVWKVQFKDASPWRLSGVELENVTLTKRDSPQAEALVLQVDALRARVRILPLFILHTSITAQVAVGNGTLTARITPLQDRTDAAVEIDDVDLGATAVFSKLAGLTLAGVVNGAADVRWTIDPHHADADLDLQISKAGVGPGKVANFLTIPQTGLGDLALNAEIKEGKLKINGFKQTGNNVNIALQASGGGQLNQPLFATSVDACFKFKAEQAFLNNNPTMRSALQLAEASLKKDTDGFINVPVAGAVNGIAVRAGNLCKK